MVKKTLLIITLVVVVFLLFGCQTAQGLKGDATYIGDKTAEVFNLD